MHQLGLNRSQLQWSYEVQSGNVTRRINLDAKVEIADVADGSRRQKLMDWIQKTCNTFGIASAMRGVIFEVRQGYKSKDSKRQQADIQTASNAYAQDYLPVLLLLSSQIDENVATRYRSALWIILKGSVAGTPQESTYAFCREVLGYDLAEFFHRHSESLRNEIRDIIRYLLT